MCCRIAPGPVVGLLVVDVEVLLMRNARVDITSRDRDRGRGSVDEYRRVSESICVLSPDPSDLPSVRGDGGRDHEVSTTCILGVTFG